MFIIIWFPPLPRCGHSLGALMLFTVISSFLPLWSSLQSPQGGRTWASVLAYVRSPSCWQQKGVFLAKVMVSSRSSKSPCEGFKKQRVVPVLLWTKGFKKMVGELELQGWENLRRTRAPNGWPLTSSLEALWRRPGSQLGCRCLTHLGSLFGSACKASQLPRSFERWAGVCLSI